MRSAMRAAMCPALGIKKPSGALSGRRTVPDPRRASCPGGGHGVARPRARPCGAAVDRRKAGDELCSSLPTEAFRKAIKDADTWYSKMAERNPTGRNITFEEVTQAVRFLRSPLAQMINGKELTVDGGLYSLL